MFLWYFLDEVDLVAMKLLKKPPINMLLSCLFCRNLSGMNLQGMLLPRLTELAYLQEM